MRKFLAAVILGFGLSCVAQADSSEGMISVKSKHNVTQTADKLEETLKSKGMTIFIRINHSKGVENVGMTLRDTEVVIFGNPKVGTPLMHCAQKVAIDLPQKALIWKDEKGEVWLSYNDPTYLAKRHDIKGCDDVLKKVSGALAKFSQLAAQ